MPFWLSWIFNLGLKWGISWLEAHVSPLVVEIVEAVLKILKNSSNPAQTALQLKAHLANFSSADHCGAPVPADLVKE